jgi:hypothetical protein
MPKFDPEGSGYDYESAKKHGVKMDPVSKHWQSREPKTGLLLKGRGHKTWHKTVAGEKKAGYEIYKKNGRYYSRKVMSEKSKKLREDQLKRHTKSASERLAKSVKESKQARADAKKYKTARAAKKIAGAYKKGTKNKPRLKRVLDKPKPKEKKNWAQKLKGKVKKHFADKKVKAKATLDRKRKESRRGRQRESLRQSGQSEEFIRKHLPWKDGT